MCKVILRRRLPTTQSSTRSHRQFWSSTQKKRVSAFVFEVLFSAPMTCITPLGISHAFSSSLEGQPGATQQSLFLCCCCFGRVRSTRSHTSTTSERELCKREQGHPGVKLPATPAPPEPSSTHSCESSRAEKNGHSRPRTECEKCY